LFKVPTILIHNLNPRFQKSKKRKIEKNQNYGA